MIHRNRKEDKEKTDPANAKKHAGEEIVAPELQEPASVAESPETTAGKSPGTGTDNAYAELNDRYLRLYSDFDNYRKRTLKEKIEHSKYASADVIAKLLPVLDDFERAIRAFDATSDAGQAVKDGMVLIFNKFLSILNQQGLEQIKTAGASFDTDFHEAITRIPAPAPEQQGKIIDEVEKGYLLHGKVIRYAKVVVGS